MSEWFEADGGPRPMMSLQQYYRKLDQWLFDEVNRPRGEMTYRWRRQEDGEISKLHGWIWLPFFHYALDSDEDE